jgi:acetylglutamate kinase
MSRPTVIKIGGAAVEADLSALWRYARGRMERGGVVVVHGGGPQSTRLARRLGHTPEIVEGRRVTTDLDLEIVKMTLGGTVNVDLTANAVAAGLPAIGLAGISERTVLVKRRPPWTIGEQSVDFGHVGDVEAIRTDLLDALFDAGRLPILACMGLDEAGCVYNVNADTVASRVAAALGATRLDVATESGGLRDETGAVMSRIGRNEALAGIEAGWIRNGMIVKVHTALDALGQGVHEVRIVHPERIGDTDSGTIIEEDQSG